MELHDRETWTRVKGLFEQAVDLPAGEGRALLERACAGDSGLLDEISSLLEAHRLSVEDGDLQSPFLEAPDPALGRRVASWRLDRLLGTGGMGAVYLASRVDGAFEQQVAVKFVRGLDAVTMRRFREERRILARLSHPRIARLLDGGRTEEGLPYLVMEYVDGTPITAYCEARKLPVEERLRLLEAVCAAVDFAHRRLVIHRDLKPSNILVTAEGQVKLLDFGIAKLVQPEGAGGSVTGTLHRAMTPDYASPEQILGEPVTTQSDLYALGVLLFQLLAGRPPYRTADLTPGEVERVVCAETPPRVSAAAPRARRRRLRGDLDILVAAAMHRDQARRPGSARELAADLRRHRRGEPISVRADSRLYVLRRFLARNRGGALAAALLLAVLLGGIVATSRQARIAERRLQGGRALANRLLLDVHDGLRDLNGSTRIRRELVANTLAYLDVLAEDSGGDPGLMEDMASAYEKVADLQGNPDEDNLGDLAGAVASYRRAVSIRERLYRVRPDPRRARDLARARGKLAVPLSYAGRTPEALALEDSALAVLAPLAAAGEPDSLTLRVEARIRAERGWLRAWEGDPVGPRPELLRAERRLSALAARDTLNLDLAVDLWRARYYLGDAYLMGGDVDSSLAWFRDGEAGLDALDARYPRNPRILRGRMGCYKRLGDVLARGNDPEAALAAYRKSLAVSEELASANPDNRTARRGVGFGYNALGAYLVQLGRPAEGIEAISRAVEIRTALHRADPANASDTNDLSISHLRLSDAYLALNRYDRALAACLEARRLHMELPPEERGGAQSLGNLAAIEASAGLILQRQGNTATGPGERADSWRGALDHYGRSLALFERMSGEGSSTGLWGDDITFIQGQADTLRALLGEAPAQAR